MRDNKSLDRLPTIFGLGTIIGTIADLALSAAWHDWSYNSVGAFILFGGVILTFATSMGSVRDAKKQHKWSIIRVVNIFWMILSGAFLALVAYVLYTLSHL